jgi:hypothetical protein
VQYSFGTPRLLKHCLQVNCFIADRDIIPNQMAGPELKDVVIATLGASAAIAGIILIFSGFLFAQAATFPVETSDKLLEKFRLCGKLGALPFVSCMAVTGISFWWMLSPGACAYWLNIWMFGITLVITTGYGVATILFLL